jgi:anti-anti-sigma factor
MHASFAIPRRLSFGPVSHRRPHSQSLRLRSSRSEPSVVVVSAFGDVDASNSNEITRHVAQVCRPRDDVVLDLGCVDFFGVEGLSVLVQINVGRGGTTDLVVVPSPAVARLLRLCHPQPSLVIAGDRDAAVAMLLGHRRSALQLVGDAP